MQACETYRFNVKRPHMRSLFHFPLPCTTTLAVTVSYSNRPTAARNVPSPASCAHSPPAPLPSAAFRCPPAPRSRAHRPPSPEYRPAAARTHWARLVHIAPTARRRARPPLALRRPRGPGWQESHRMHPFFAECAKKAPFLATSARNACFSRSRWQHPRPMHPFPGAIGRFRIHGARILPPRALFRVGEPEITHGAKVLPAPRGLSAAAACGPAELALRHAARAWPACRMRPPCHLACARRGLRPAARGMAERPLRPALTLCRPRPATRSPYRCISPPARRTHPASRADPPRPGNKRNNANNSMRA